MALISAKDYLNGGKASADEKQNTGLVSATDFLNEKYKPRDMLSPDQFNAQHGLNLIHPMQIMAPNSPLSQALQKKTEQPQVSDGGGNLASHVWDAVKSGYHHAEGGMAGFVNGLFGRDIGGNYTDGKVSPWESLGEGFLHPDQANQAYDKLKTDAAPITAPILGGGLSGLGLHDPSGTAGRVASDMLFDTARDPLTYTPLPLGEVATGIYRTAKGASRLVRGAAEKSAEALAGATVKDALRGAEHPPLGFSALGKSQPERYANPADPTSIGQLIDVGGRPAREGNSLSKAYTATVDELHPLNQATKALGGKDVPIEQNPYEQAWLSRGWRGKADTALEYGFIDETGNKVASGLKEAIQPVSGALDDWRNYAVALRSLEYERDGLVSGVPKALAEKTIAELGSKPEVVAAQKQIRQYIDDMNNATLVKSGVRSAEQQAKLSKEHPNYIPMFRTREKGIRDVPQSASNKRFGNQKDPLKKRTGSVQPIVDPLESIVKETYKNTAISEKNNVMRTLVELAEKNPENSIIRPVTAEESALSQTQKALDDFLMNPTDDLEKGLTDALDLFTPKNVGGKKNVFTVMRDGKAEQWEVLDNELAKTIAGLNNESVGVLANLLGKPTGVLKAGLVLAPDFLFKNLVRDQLSAFINSKYGFIPIWDMMRGLSSAIKKDDAFYQWMASGGANGAWVSLERDYLQGQIRKMTRQGMQKMPKNPVEWLRVLSEVSEQSTRIGEFKRGVKATGNLQEAALASRDVTLDFSRSGSKTKGINKAVAFFNVAVQSIDKTVRQFKARPGQTFAKAVTAITLPSVLLYLKNHNDPRYQELPQWEKDTYWHFFAGDTTFRIPKPFELGVIFGTYPERQLQAMMESDPTAFEGFAKTVVDGFTPSVMPTLFMPWVEAFANKKTFTGAPIVPKREEGLMPQDQYGPYTSEVGKMAGKVTNTAPRIVDNYILGYTGTLGKYALDNADRLLEKVGAADRVPKADQGLAGTPIIRSFVSKGLEGSSKSVDDFYKEKDKLSREQASAKKNASGNDNAGTLQMYNMIGGYISDLQKQSQSVLEDRTMTPQEKRDKLKDINLNITNLARSAKGLAPIE